MDTGPRIAVIGAGHWGRNHVRNFAALGALAAVCDASPLVLEDIRLAYPEVATYSDIAEVLADRAIDSVVVATPATQHFAAAGAALAEGRHVLVEKPMTLDVAEARELDRMAAERHLVLMVGHLLEYHPAFVTLRDMMWAGELGEVMDIHSSRLSAGPFRHTEGVLWDLAPHDLSMILRLMGREPESVAAFASSHVLPGVDDAATVILFFAGNVQAHIRLSWLHPVKEQRLVVVGRRETAVFDDVVKESKLELYPTPSAAGPQPSGPQVVPYPPSEPLRVECEMFLRCVATGDRPLTDGASGVQNTRVIAACERSIRAGGARVSTD